MQDINLHFVSLQERWKKLLPRLELDSKKESLESLQLQMQQEGFWNDPKVAQSVSQKAAQLEKFINHALSLQSTLEDFPSLLELSREADQSLLESELESLESKLKTLETETLLSGEYDDAPAILSVHVGTGGQDAEEFTQWLERMYLRYSEKKGFKVQILEESQSDVGLKSCTLSINGPFAYGLLKAEHGVQRLIRLSPFNAKNLRQTSFAKVEVIPEIEEDGEINLSQSDLRIDVFRSSGAGGQSVNTTDSAVRITYLPLNLVVSCQNERSQMQNKEMALRVLKSRILQLKKQEQVEKVSQIRGESLKADFSNQIRTFTLQPYQLVKDHRTGYEDFNPSKVLDGEIDGFIEAFLHGEKP